MLSSDKGGKGRSKTTPESQSSHKKKKSPHQEKVKRSPLARLSPGKRQTEPKDHQSLSIGLMCSKDYPEAYEETMRHLEVYRAKLALINDQVLLSSYLGETSYKELCDLKAAVPIHKLKYELVLIMENELFSKWFNAACKKSQCSPSQISEIENFLRSKIVNIVRTDISNLIEFGGISLATIAFQNTNLLEQAAISISTAMLRWPNLPPILQEVMQNKFLEDGEIQALQEGMENKFSEDGEMQEIAAKEKFILDQINKYHRLIDKIGSLKEEIFQQEKEQLGKEQVPEFISSVALAQLYSDLGFATEATIVIAIASEISSDETIYFNKGLIQVNLDFLQQQLQSDTSSTLPCLTRCRELNFQLCGLLPRKPHIVTEDISLNDLCALFTNIDSKVSLSLMKACEEVFGTRTSAQKQNLVLSNAELIMNINLLIINKKNVDLIPKIEQLCQNEFKEIKEREDADKIAPSTPRFSTAAPLQRTERVRGYLSQRVTMDDRATQTTSTTTADPTVQASSIQAVSPLSSTVGLTGFSLVKTIFPHPIAEFSGGTNEITQGNEPVADGYGDLFDSGEEEVKEEKVEVGKEEKLSDSPGFR